MEDETLSGKGEEALQPEIRERLLEEYLRDGYKAKSKQHEIVIDGVAYKALERIEITAFYDSSGNTLFNISNEQLKSDYESMLQQDIQTCAMMEQIKDTDLPCYGGLGDKCSLCERLTEDNLKEEIDSEDADSQNEDGRLAKSVAKEKLEKELEGAKDKNFAEPIIGYLLKRCEEDEGVSEDVAQEHKTWDKCFDYIYNQARKQATGNRVAVRDDVVYEWAEDYYHKDDKAEEEKKAKKTAERKKKQENKAIRAKAVPKAEVPKPMTEPKPKKNSKDMDGQLDLFSMVEM